MAENVEVPAPGQGAGSASAASAPGASPSTQLTPAQLEARREVHVEWLEKEWVMALIGFLVIYLTVGDVVTTWKEGSSWLGAIWKFLKSYGGFLLMMTLILGVFAWSVPSYKAAVKAWGEYVLLLLAGPLALWFWAGSYNWWRDVLIGVIVFIVLYICREALLNATSRWVARVELWRRRLVLQNLKMRKDAGYGPREIRTSPGSIRKRPTVWLHARFMRPAGRRFYTVLAWLFFTWLLGSFADRVFGPSWISFAAPVEATAGRFTDISNQWADTWAKTPPQRLGVALSGGGFRAALLHAGVLHALEERGIPIAGLATVSGGSIIGGFYVAGGRPADFRDAVAEGRFNLKRELIDFPNPLMLPCPAHIPVLDIKLLWWCSYSRVDVQSHLLDRVLFGEKTVEQLRKERGGNAEWWRNPPWWVIGATDLRHGDGVGMSVDGILRRAHATPGRGLHQTDLRRVPSDVSFEDLTAQQTFGTKRVAELIAVSGAFPGAFGSTRFPITENDSLQIVDGGITDNLGYSLLMSALEKAPNSPHEREWALDMVLVSDGGMPLREDKNLIGYTEFFRAMDVVYASSGILVKPNGLNKIWLSPRAVVSGELSAQDFARLPDAIRKQRKLDALADFQADFDKARNFFLDTSTLKDRFDEGWLASLDRRFWHKDKLPGGREAVDALFTLGQYLVYVNLPDICKGLKLPNEKCQR